MCHDTRSSRGKPRPGQRRNHGPGNVRQGTKPPSAEQNGGSYEKPLFTASAAQGFPAGATLALPREHR